MADVVDGVERIDPSVVRCRESVTEWSGLRESDPSSWLGKPEHYHYAKPACWKSYCITRLLSTTLAGCG